MEFSNKKFSELWIPGSELSFDEMMVHFQGDCPHHVFIKRKPHPHGMKLWSLVDLDKFVNHIQLYRRSTEEYDLPVIYNGNNKFTRICDVDSESTTATVIKMLAPMSPFKGIIYVDSYFGSLDLFETLTDEGFDCVAACRKDRPSWLFSF